MRALLAIIFASVATFANAQIVNPPNADLTPLQQRIDNVQAAIPPVCDTAPMSDTPNGTAGAATPCVNRSDARRPARGMWTRATTDSACQITWNFSQSFNNPVISVTTQDAGAPVLWNITAISGTGVTLRASRVRSLPNTITLLTALVGYEMVVNSGTTCAGVMAHIGVREQLIP